MTAWAVDGQLVAEWLGTLAQDSYEQVLAALELVSEYGPQLGRPLVDTVRGSRHKNMKELRPGSSGRTELRVLFAFDARRTAVLLVGGDKAGRWEEWYRSSIPTADRLFAAHQRRWREE